jgi:hypothetical protein
VLIALSVVGLVGLLLALWFGFEEPNFLLLSASLAMLMAMPLTVLVHLTWTPALTAERKRVWWNEFASSGSWSALSEYLSSPDLGVSADRRAKEAEARRRR